MLEMVVFHFLQSVCAAPKVDFEVIFEKGFKRFFLSYKAVESNVFSDIRYL